MAPVKTPQPAVGGDPKAFAGQCLIALDDANRRLINTPKWYNGVVQDYMSGGGN